MGWPRKLYARCGRQGKLGICDLPVNHTGDCSMTLFTQGMRSPRAVPIDPKEVTP